MKQAIRRMQEGAKPTPAQLLMNAAEEAIADARQRSMALQAAGLAGTVEHLKLVSQIMRWEHARRQNR
ncbi:MAG TPA: hypothetical protein VEC35_09365 [Noviherbaspirillum sp.]|nr:hypothetical protein [Noviherbaspirillum sp.]